MGFYGNLWINLNIYECLWMLMGVCGGLWESIDKYEYLSVYGCLGVRVYLRECIGP